MAGPMSDFALEDGDLSTDAMREQLALIMALYWRSRERWDDMIALSNQAVTPGIFFLRPSQATETFDEVVTPSFATMETADGRFWCHLAGTESGLMWGGNLGGALTRTDFLDSGVNAHGYFEDLSRQIEERIFDHHGANYAPAKLRVAGHSLGGGVAFLLGCRLKKRLPSADVQVLTYGAPRSLGAGYEGPSPDHHFRVVNSWDPVTWLPPGTSQLEAYFYFDGLKKLFRQFSWSHYGEEYWYTSEGRLDPHSSLDSHAVIHVERWDETLTHFSPAYLRMASAEYRRNGGNEQSAAMLGVAAKMMVEEGDTWDRYKLPDPVKFTDLAAVNQRAGLPAGTINAQNFGSLDGTTVRALASQEAGPVLAAIEAQEARQRGEIPAVFAAGFAGGGGDVATWKVTFDYTMGVQGWRESYYLLNQSGDVTTDKPAILALAKARQALLGQGGALAPDDPYIRAIRVVDVGTPNLASKRRFRANQWPHANSSADAGDMWQAVTVTLSDASGRSRRQLQLPGMPLTWIPLEYDELDLELKTTEGREALKGFLNLLAPENGVSAWGLRVATAPNPADQIVQQVTVDSLSGAFKLRLLTPAFAVGDRVTIRGAKGAGLRGLNGRHRVTAREEGGLLITINQRQCETCVVFVETPPTIRSAQAVSYLPITRAEFNGASKKNPSVPTLPHRGRRRKRCCR